MGKYNDMSRWDEYEAATAEPASHNDTASHAAAAAGVQAQARDWCRRRGLDTPEKVRAEAGRLANLMFAAGDRDWAKKIMQRAANGEPIPTYAVELARSVAPEGYGT